MATGRRLAQVATPSSAPDRLLAFAAVPAPESQARRASLLRRLGSAGADVASLEPAHPGLRRALRIGVPALVLAFLALALVTQWQRLPEVDWRLEPGWLALSLLAFLAFQALHAETWRLLLAALGGEFPSRTVGWAAYSTSLLARYVPTNALIFVVRVALSRREGVARRVCLVSMVYEGALALSAALIVGAYFVIRLPALAGEPLRLIVLVIPLAALAALHPRVFHPLANALLRRLGRHPLPLSLRFSRVLLFGALYVLSFLVAGLGVYALAAALHPLEASGAAPALAAYAIGFTFSVLGFFLPAGLGAREAGLAGALALALPPTVALAVAVGVRVVQTAVELLYAGATSALARRDRFRRPGSWATVEGTAA